MINRKRVYTIVGIIFVISTIMQHLPTIKGESELSIKDFMNTTLLGGSDGDGISQIEIDTEFNIIAAGSTLSADFPVTYDAYQVEFNGGTQGSQYFESWGFIAGDGFIVKFSDYDEIVWATYIGGSNIDGIIKMVLDSENNIYAIGATNSLDFPVTDDAYRSVYGGGEWDSFLVKFSSDGDLLYSTYLGGNQEDFLNALAIDNQNSIYITGHTYSNNIITTENSLYNKINGTRDMIIYKFSENLTNPSFISYWGGSEEEWTFEVSIDSLNNIIITGGTTSLDFRLLNPYQSNYGGGEYDTYVLKFDSNFDLIFSTYLGGSEQDNFKGMVITNNDNIVLAGYFTSTDFPVQNSFQSDHNGGNNDAGIINISPDGHNVEYASFFGGSYGNEEFFSIHETFSGEIIATGVGNRGFPTVNTEEQAESTGKYLSIIRLDYNFTVDFCSILGNSHRTIGNVIASLPNDIIVIGGWTDADEFPISDNSLKNEIEGGSDGYLMLFDVNGFVSSLDDSSLDLQDLIYRISNSLHFIFPVMFMSFYIIYKRLYKKILR